LLNTRDIYLAAGSALIGLWKASGDFSILDILSVFESKATKVRQFVRVEVK
jgi:hypothetical protein